MLHVILLALLSTSHAGPTSGKFKLCHYSATDGSFTLMSLPTPAIRAHLAHGDLWPGSYWPDTDGDGAGDAAAEAEVCPFDGAVESADDCDDADPTTYEGAEELLDGVDNDCDGLVDEGLYLADCLEIILADPSSPSGTYTIDPDGVGGESPFDVSCEMDIDGGGWTALIPAFVETLAAGEHREYLYSYDAAWYRSPATTLVWSWSEFQILEGSYAYSAGSTTAEGSFSCTHTEDGDWGIGCSEDLGDNYKVLTIYGSDPANARGTVCQDEPDVFGVGACQGSTSLWVRAL